MVREPSAPSHRLRTHLKKPECPVVAFRRAVAPRFVGEPFPSRKKRPGSQKLTESARLCLRAVRDSPPKRPPHHSSHGQIQQILDSKRNGTKKQHSVIVCARGVSFSRGRHAFHVRDWIFRAVQIGGGFALRMANTGKTFAGEGSERREIVFRQQSSEAHEKKMAGLSESCFACSVAIRRSLVFRDPIYSLVRLNACGPFQ